MDSRLLILFLLLLTLSFSAKSQNLTYSRTMLISSPGDTVPAGKVWKITNVLSTLNDNGSSKIEVNGKDIVVAFSKSSNGQTSNTGNFWNNHNYYTGLQGAYWLPAGTILNTGDNVEYISVIEFNE